MESENPMVGSKKTNTGQPGVEIKTGLENQYA